MLVSKNETRKWFQAQISVTHRSFGSLSLFRVWPLFVERKTFCWNFFTFWEVFTQIWCGIKWKNQIRAWNELRIKLFMSFISFDPSCSHRFWYFFLDIQWVSSTEACHRMFFLGNSFYPAILLSITKVVLFLCSLDL